MRDYSDYSIYVDESGDYGLERINAEYPLFVLAFCLVSKEEQRTRIGPGRSRLFRPPAARLRDLAWPNP